MKEILINKRLIGGSNAPFIIAEISANHNGSIDNAKKLIGLASQYGADAVKIQSYEPDSLTFNLSDPDFIIDKGLWKGKSLYQLYSEAFTPFSWHEELFDFANREGITLFSSPFDERAVDLLESLNAPAYKIASFELCDLPLIARVANAGKPIIMSTGLSSLDEIDDAVKVANQEGCEEIILLHCVSSYPSKVEESCLSNIKILQERYNLNIGLSDHTLDNTSSIIAASMGACVIEKHFIDSRIRGGVDSSFSIEPEELRELKKITTQAWQSVRNSEFERPSIEKENIKFKRSLYFAKDLSAGDKIEDSSIKRIRPGYGLAPKYFYEIVGKTLKNDVKFGQKVSWDCFLN